MIIDSSVIVAILLGERESTDLMEAIGSSETRIMSTASYLESGIVIDRKRSDLLSLQLDELIQTFQIVFEPVTSDQALLARAAYRAFGKESGSAAELNFGDCFSYALAIETGEPLLFKGGDFNHTDVRIDTRSIIVE